mgnify:FL=1
MIPSLRRRNALIFENPGVKTNIPFLFRVLSHDVFVTGKTWTTVHSSCLVRSHPNLTPLRSSSTIPLPSLTSSPRRTARRRSSLTSVTSSSTARPSKDRPASPVFSRRSLSPPLSTPRTRLRRSTRQSLALSDGATSSRRGVPRDSPRLSATTPEFSSWVRWTRTTF